MMLGCCDYPHDAYIDAFNNEHQRHCRYFNWYSFMSVYDMGGEPWVMPR